MAQRYTNHTGGAFLHQPVRVVRCNNPDELEFSNYLSAALFTSQASEELLVLAGDGLPAI